MDRRTILALLVMIVILFLFQTFFNRSRQKPQPAPAATAPTASAPAPASSTAGQTAQPGQPGPARPAPSAGEPALVEPGSDTITIDTLVVENDKVRLAFTNRGAALVSARLKRYGNAELVPGGRPVLTSRLRTADGRPVDLAGHPFHFTRNGNQIVFSSGLVYRNPADSLAAKNKPVNRRLTDSTQARAITFTKTYTLGDGYQLGLALGLAGPNKGYELGWRSGAAVTEKDSVDDLAHFKMLDRLSDRVSGYGSRDVKTKLLRTGPFDWVALRSKYFIAAIRSAPGQTDSVDAWPLTDTITVEQKILFWTTGINRRIENRRIGMTLVSRGTRTGDRYDIYLAPLDYSLLRSFGAGLDRTVDLGWSWIRPISFVLLEFFKLLYKLFRNYGVAIIIFAFLMKLAFFPLTRRMTLQMKRMQQLQPKLEELKKRFKDDPKALNQETMQLYKLHKVNPLGGCLPLVIQMPIFFALYAVLRATIDLRGAHFVFWIKDLSVKDPYFVLPILMGVFSLIQSLLTTTDKRQRLLQYGMPIFMTVIFLNFPSGLQLYWLTYNILSIIEIYLTKKGGTQ